jgi:hypothetical protein
VESHFASYRQCVSERSPSVSFAQSQTDENPTKELRGLLTIHSNIKRNTRVPNQRTADNTRTERATRRTAGSSVRVLTIAMTLARGAGTMSMRMRSSKIRHRKVMRILKRHGRRCGRRHRERARIKWKRRSLADDRADRAVVKEICGEDQGFVLSLHGVVLRKQNHMEYRGQIMKGRGRGGILRCGSVGSSSWFELCLWS